ncbi:MAG: class I tRNA ligase family protein, partial [Clostridia bacterium]|nr:class I tRNA ligase family protein [Clostridia bacterium]
ITFWVSKMIFMGIENTGKKPFSDVFIHGLVRDAQGRKMSKSLGNGIDPLEIVDSYGADALRYALASGNAPGNDMRFSQDRIEAARNFINKIWNASRFVRMNLDIDRIVLPETDALSLEDKWILDRLNTLSGDVRRNLDDYELGVALQKLTDFIRDEFCDWYIELAKERLSDKSHPGNPVAQNVIAYVLSDAMKLIHPFIPFITEEIWQALPHEGVSIMTSDYPSPRDELSFPEASGRMADVIGIIGAIRTRRAEMNVAHSRKTKIFIVPKKASLDGSVSHFFTRLASASEVVFADSYDGTDAVQIVTDAAVSYIPLADMIDTEKEIARLTKEKEDLEKEIARLTAKLSNEGFVSKAPANVVEAERAKLEKYSSSLEGVLSALGKLS